MPYYKDLDGKVHFVENNKFKHLLPEGCESITKAEADEIRDQQSQPSNEESIKFKFYKISVERSKRMKALSSINPADNPETYMNYLSCRKVMGTIIPQEETLLIDLLAIFEASLTIGSDMASDIDPANYDVISNPLWP